MMNRLLIDQFKITTRDLAEILVDVVYVLKTKTSEKDAVRYLREKYSNDNDKFIVSLLLYGKFLGSYAMLSDPEVTTYTLMKIDEFYKDILEGKREELIQNLANEMDEFIREFKRFIEEKERDVI